MKRILTALVATPFILAALFFLPAPWFLVFVLAVMTGAVYEYLGIVRPQAPGAPLSLLYLLVPAAAAVLAVPPEWLNPTAEPHFPLVAAAALAAVGLGTLLLWSRTPLAELLPALGILGFGVPWFAVAAASLYHLKRQDPWLVFLLFAIVWLGDTGAFYVGARFGRHKMTPVVSPKKSWEGAVAGIVTGLVSTAVWSFVRLGRIDPGLLAVAAVTGVAAIAGDLVESMIKRGAGVKDSGSVLPGHGGFLDRVDATLFAAPVFLLGLWLLRFAPGR